MLLEDTLDDVERGFPHKDVLMKQVIGEDLDSSREQDNIPQILLKLIDLRFHSCAKGVLTFQRNTILPGRKGDVPPLHEAEHGQTHVVVEPVETLPSLGQITEAVHQLVIQPLVLEADLRYSEVIGSDDLGICGRFV